MYRPIGDYGVIGNLRTVALVSRAGSIDWLCLPHLDSPSVFGAILDDTGGGRFALAPIGDCSPAAEYLPGTNILVTRFVSGAGETEITAEPRLDSLSRTAGPAVRRSTNRFPDPRILSCTALPPPGRGGEGS